jgi:hypothetical protein
MHGVRVDEWQYDLRGRRIEMKLKKMRVWTTLAVLLVLVAACAARGVAPVPLCQRQMSATNE